MTGAMAGAPMLELAGVRFNGPAGAPLLSDVSLSAAAGEILAIVGPNGAGKTTLMRLIAGLAAPAAGAVRIGGVCLRQMRLAERARTIAYVGQSDAPDGRLTVRQYVALGLECGGGPRPSRPDQRGGVAPVLGALGLSSLADRRIDRISGGERQKAKIARAVCQRPKLLVLDEPTNHLDPQARGALLRWLGGMEITVVAALHDLTLIDAFADKVAMIEQGRLVAFSGPEAALSAEQVRRVFQVDLYRFPHPSGGPDIAALDVMGAPAAPRTLHS